MLRAARIALYALALLLLVLIGFLIWASRPAIAAIDRPDPRQFSPTVVARGAMLANIGNCASCHTSAHGPAFAGAAALQTNFGTIYSTNITPDPETGIGRWSEQAFARALREGVSRDGHHLYPAFPYDHFTELSDPDIAALYAFFMTRPPVHSKAPGTGFFCPCASGRFSRAGSGSIFIRSAIPHRIQANISPKGSRIAVHATRRTAGWGPSCGGGHTTAAG